METFSKKLKKPYQYLRMTFRTVGFIYFKFEFTEYCLLTAQNTSIYRHEVKFYYLDTFDTR